MLLNYNDETFESDNLTLVLDGTYLEPICANEVSGTVRISSDWGEGDLHFAALAVSEASGERWLSNVEILPHPDMPEEIPDLITEMTTEETTEAVTEEATGAAAG